jgi:hypothetical protein
MWAANPGSTSNRGRGLVVRPVAKSARWQSAAGGPLVCKSTGGSSLIAVGTLAGKGEFSLGEAAMVSGMGVPSLS